MSIIQAGERARSIAIVGVVEGMILAALIDGSSAGWLIWPTLGGAIVAGVLTSILLFLVSGAESEWFSTALDSAAACCLGANAVWAVMAALDGNTSETIWHGILAGILLVVVVTRVYGGGEQVDFATEEDTRAALAAAEGREGA